MPLDDDAGRLRRARTIATWVKAHHEARTKNARLQSTKVQNLEHPQSRRQVASRAQRAASEALDELHRRQRQEGQSQIRSCFAIGMSISTVVRTSA